jgi:hypothetical protein
MHGNQLGHGSACMRLVATAAWLGPWAWGAGGQGGGGGSSWWLVGWAHVVRTHLSKKCINEDTPPESISCANSLKYWCHNKSNP